MKHVGILGGTFDPPHIGHLIIAEEVRNAMSLDEIWFMPSHEPPHKQNAVADASDRAEMTERAIAGNPYFSVQTIEVNRLGKSYTFDTMKLLKEEHPDTNFYFIIGADMVEYLPHWKHVDELMDMLTFVGVKRGGYALESEYPVTEVDVPLIEISSTEIKKRLTQNKSIKYMVLETVETYLKEKHLYEGR
ncbi:nicotinate-nucleotide adenylyltransferase [Lentibacillus amyloliquefaciens]|uniref:Probable nicotinate-nucleotide adenylyltransferase n=1 Tax=Lentibacillus amyloliquefaciens TaxID=1472767 RepID=A0A0U3W4M8_9BACI|nr:nicotinate-nucleotide adenylyltransferase [Lentibacillus amyloliquefaciens]ALX48144.1 nicotinate-nicotinamide nucleotide adenylyltransferase [Lentibacillus amyloliquefaciens]